MGKRKSDGLLGDVFAVASRLPWPIGVGAAVLSFVIFHGLAGIDVGTVISTKEIGVVAARKMFQMVGLIGQFVVPIACLVGAGVGYLRQRQGATEPQTTTSSHRSPVSKSSQSSSDNSRESPADCPSVARLWFAGRPSAGQMQAGTSSGAADTRIAKACGRCNQNRQNRRRPMSIAIDTTFDFRSDTPEGADPDAYI